ncbi:MULTISPECIES: Rieske 2Fe-2S domain-containing protein [unclassified Kitasatospora]|uniref:Rieske 2Fe-2S domain-containing protein n=1 Tax=unclassified Kitasatospora TaxID=2633591 RepID=UPI003722F6EB
MPVVTFKAGGADNCARVAGLPYVYIRTEAGGSVLPASCPHRGGPLNLGTPDPTGRRLVCPWHERGSSLSRLRRQVPAVRSGDTVTAVLPGPADAAAELCHLPLSPALAAGA